ncbi:hypothetical protein AN958_10587 [Leucoagaricus sp. SymC.cos]|nr:hypothetical protein AN958_10587 [Leucoagaricus sp. SymC.cos]
MEDDSTSFNKPVSASTNILAPQLRQDRILMPRPIRLGVHRAAVCTWGLRLRDHSSDYSPSKSTTALFQPPAAPRITIMDLPKVTPSSPFVHHQRHKLAKCTNQKPSTLPLSTLSDNRGSQFRLPSVRMILLYMSCTKYRPAHHKGVCIPGEYVCSIFSLAEYEDIFFYFIDPDRLLSFPLANIKYYILVLHPRFNSRRAHYRVNQLDSVRMIGEKASSSRLSRIYTCAP